MPSEIQTLGKVVGQILGVDIQINPNGHSLLGKNRSGTGPVARVAVEYTPWEGCQLTFDIATIPPEEKCHTAPILQTIFGTFPGVFTVKSSPQGATIYYRLQYPQISFGLQGSTQILKDLEQVKQIGDEIHQYLPIVSRSANSKSLYEGLPLVHHVELMSQPIASRLNDCLPGDPSMMLDVLLGHRILLLEVEDFYQRNLILGWLSTQLAAWNQSIGRFLLRRFSDHDLLDVLAKVPFALAADLSGYTFHHLTEEMEKLTRHICELSKPFIGILPVGHPFIYQELAEGTIVSLKNIQLDIDFWLDYLLEAEHPIISHMEKGKIVSEILPDISSWSSSELRPEIIQSCINRYFNRLRNKDDHLKSTKEYLFKTLET